jgi:hypothetical protein
MENRFLGVPLPILGMLALLITVIWIFVWPSDRAALGEPVRYFILRWFHAIVWLLLALAAFIAGFNLPGGVRLAKPVAFVSLIIYLIFMAAFLTSRKLP